MRPKDRASAIGLLPRMEARPRKDGLTTYRYHPVGAKPIKLGTDKMEACRKVLAMNGEGDSRGTVDDLWARYKDSSDWKALAPRTRLDYADYSVELLKRMGKVHASLIRPADVARYLRKERSEAPIRANREMALLSNLMNLAIEAGELEVNPCKQVRRNKERPRTMAPDPADFARFLDWIAKQSPQRQMVGMMAEYAALVGSRRMEFLQLSRPQIDREAGVIRVQRGKQHEGQVKFEVIDISPPLGLLLDRLLALPHAADRLYVFTTRSGNPYADDGFTTMWHRIRAAALKEGVIRTSFTFHDLRAYYTTQHKAQYGNLPDLHASEITTARVYDRTKVAQRKGLKG